MTISQLGALNTTALVVPNIYVQIVPPQTLFLNGVPTNIVGVVGTASWGPVNQAVIIGSASNYVAAFGPIQNRKHDMGTHVFVGIQQGGLNYRCIRVTDGTDVAATVSVLTTCLTISSRYTGSTGNTAAITIAPGSQTGTFSVTVAMPNLNSERFDNIGLGLTGNALWVAIANAINNGNSALRGASQIIIATAGVGTTAPAAPAVSYALAGGTDGVAAITSAVMIGLDVAPRTGMYAMRGLNCSVADMCDLDDSATWTTQAGFGLAEGIYMICVAAAGIQIQNGTTGIIDIKASAGLDSYAVKLMHGDWIYWSDPQNALVRLVSPQAFVMGLMSNLSPENSTLNKQLYGVVGSQKSGIPGSGQAQIYADADLQALFLAGVDVISNPQPGGSYWGVRAGHNSSSFAPVHGDNYTRMTNYIASTLNAGMGIYVGQLINPTLLKRVNATLNSFFANLLNQGLLAFELDGSQPWAVVCNLSNNPPSRTGLGYLQADVQVQYQAINEFFLVNVEGGQTVTITKTSTISAV